MPTPSTTTAPTPADPYEVWKQKPTPKNLRSVVQAHEPTISAALRSYTPGLEKSNTLRRRAELLAANAVQSYDPKRGAQLRTHLMSQLQQLRQVASTFADPFPKPRRLQQESGLLNSQKTELTDILGREPTIEELSDYGNWDVRKVRRMLRRERAVVPESSLIPEDGDDEDEFMPGVKKNDPVAIWADYLYHDLKPVDRLIFQYRTGYGGAPILPNQEIAKRVKMSPGNVSKRAAELQARLDEVRTP